MSQLHLPETYNPSFHGAYETHPWISTLPYRVLGSTNLRVSTLSYGGSSLGGFYGNVEQQEAVDTIQESIKSGINYLDTSPWYGESEAIIGKALADIPRDTYYIGTKVGRNFTPTWEGRFDFSSSAVLKSFERSLERLGLNYVDIIQIHDVEFCADIEILIKETIPALESLVLAGKAKFIGITSYDLKLLEKIVCREDINGILSTVLSYARLNFHDNALLDSAKIFTNQGLGIINAAPLAMGLLSNSGPPNWHPASMSTKRAAKNAATLAICKGTTIGNASLGYSLRPVNQEIATTLVSMPTKKILEENLSIVTTPVTQEDSDLYKLISNEFKLQNGNRNDWEGVETRSYKEWIETGAQN